MESLFLCILEPIKGDEYTVYECTSRCTGMEESSIAIDMLSVSAQAAVKEMCLCYLLSDDACTRNCLADASKLCPHRGRLIGPGQRLSLERRSILGHSHTDSTVSVSVVEVTHARSVIVMCKD